MGGRYPGASQTRSTIWWLAILAAASAGACSSDAARTPGTSTVIDTRDGGTPLDGDGRASPPIGSDATPFDGTASLDAAPPGIADPTPAWVGAACGTSVGACAQGDCLCGTCSQRCEADAECRTALGHDAARCYATHDPVFFDMCRIGSVTGRVCAIACNRDEDCPFASPQCILPRTFPPSGPGFCMRRPRPPGDGTTTPEVVARSCAEEFCAECDEQDLATGRSLEPYLSCTPLFGGCETSVECVTHADCAESPHGWCSGLTRDYCRYPSGAVPLSSCNSDGDCTAAPEGRCERTVASTRCEYDACASDAECGPGRACVCKGSLKYCVGAECTTNADCPGDEQCRTATSPCSGYWGRYCTTDNDECEPDCSCDYYVEDPVPHFTCRPDMYCGR